MFYVFFNFSVERLAEKGIIDKIRTSIWPKPEEKQRSCFNAVGVTDVFQMFLFLAWGVLISFLFLALERFYVVRNIPPIVKYKLYYKRCAAGNNKKRSE